MLGKLFCGVMYSDTTLVKAALSELRQKFGEVELESEEFDFSFTPY
jgi:hypothetical protein